MVLVFRVGVWCLVFGVWWRSYLKASDGSQEILDLPRVVRGVLVINSPTFWVVHIRMLQTHSVHPVE